MLLALRLRLLLNLAARLRLGLGLRARGARVTSGGLLTGLGLRTRLPLTGLNLSAGALLACLCGCARLLLARLLLLWLLMLLRRRLLVWLALSIRLREAGDSVAVRQSQCGHRERQSACSRRGHEPCHNTAPHSVSPFACAGLSSRWTKPMARPAFAGQPVQGRFQCLKPVQACKGVRFSSVRQTLRSKGDHRACRGENGQVFPTGGKLALT